MPRIELKGITKMFGKVAAVKDLNLVIEDREFVTLLGPSGCGKTTTLRMISGLETPTSGEIVIDGKVVFSSEKQLNLSPDKRDVGLLFQNYALWPHMTVYQNIAFGLENLKWKKEDIARKVTEMGELVKISELMARYPSELSGGQQQRVAIARTLAPDPRVLLMDEPLSNLDAKLRMEMRSELKRLHQQIQSTTVYVTHDQLEAMTLATKICLMEEGVLQQYAPPLHVYDSPANLFVADFIGNPSMNLLELSVNGVENNRWMLGDRETQLVFSPQENGSLPKVGEKVFLGIRPEDISLSLQGKTQASIYSVLPSGMETVLKVRFGERLLSVVVFGRKDFLPDTPVGLHFEGNWYHIFDGTGGKLLATGGLSLE